MKAKAILKMRAGRNARPVALISPEEAACLLGKNSVGQDHRRWVVLVDRRSRIQPEAGDLVLARVAAVPRPGLVFVDVLQILETSTGENPIPPAKWDGQDWVVNLPGGLGAIYVATEHSGEVVVRATYMSRWVARDALQAIRQFLAENLEWWNSSAVPLVRVRPGQWVLVCTPGYGWGVHAAWVDGNLSWVRGFLPNGTLEVPEDAPVLPAEDGFGVDWTEVQSIRKKGQASTSDIWYGVQFRGQGKAVLVLEYKERTYKVLLRVEVEK